MRRELLYIGGVILLLILLHIYFPYVKERFETSNEMVQDRANPLAAQQHPLTNPATNIGILQGPGADIRQLSQAALNSPFEESVFNGSTAFGLTSQPTINTLSPRIDNEDSFLGLIKFCKDTVVSSGANAWENAKFSKNCGICMADTTLLIDGSKIYKDVANGTGVLVYKEDKDIAIATQTNNNFRYPRAIPSLRSATCLGANLTIDDTVPVLAINSNMYAEMLARNSCRHDAAFKTDGSCGQCQSDPDKGQWSYIKEPPAGSLNTISLTLFGNGTATVKVKGDVVLDGQNKSLSATPTTIPLGNPNVSPFVKEGDELKIEITGGTATNNVYVYGIISSSNPDGTLYSLDLYDSLSKDDVTDQGPKSQGKNAFGTSMLTKIIPGNSRTSMLLKGEIPLTFINGTNNDDKTKNQIAYYDCKTGPYKIHGDVIVRGDYCPNTGPYSPACIRKLLSDSGCTSAGQWYQSGSLPESITGSNLPVIRSWLTERVEKADTEPDTFAGCYGVSRTNTCADYINTETVPSRACLSQLYDNTITKNNLGKSGGIQPYIQAGENFLNYRALNDGQTERYCRSEGSLNPSSGDTTLSNIAATGYNSLRGIAAVNKYLSDVYTRAVDSTKDIHKEDNNGGRKTSWEKCFGINIASKKLIPVNNINDTTACTQIMGKQNVYLLENTESSQIINYETVGIPSIYSNTYWIWGDRIYSARSFKFYLNYCNGNGVFTGTLKGQIRNNGSIKINDTTVPYTTGALNNTVQIGTGNNSIVVTSTGTTAIAGFWLVLLDLSGNVLMQTDQNWRCEPTT